MANSETLIPIPGRLHSVATEGHVAGADEIYDDQLSKTQETINAEVKEAIGTGGSVDSRISAAINALDSTKSQSAGADGLALNIVEENGKITSISGSIESNTYDTYGAASAAQSAAISAAATDATNKVSAAKTELLGDAASDYNTLGKLEDKIQAEASRAQAAESSLSSGKADKATTLAGYGITDAYTKSETYTKTEVNGLVDTPHQEYVTVATYSALPATGSKDTIYRVSNYNGSTSQVDASVYSEYAWNGSQYIFLCVKSQIGEVFDISAYNNNAKYADLADALNGGANIPQSLQKGGMSIKFVQTFDNKYVQFRLMSDTFNTTLANWQGVDDEPTAGSDNLVKSGGVQNLTRYLSQEYQCFRRYKTSAADAEIAGGLSGNLKSSVYKSFLSLKMQGFDKTQPCKLSYLMKNNNSNNRIILDSWDGTSWNKVYDMTLTNSEIATTSGIVKWSGTYQGRTVFALIDFSMITDGYAWIDGSEQAEPNFIIKEECFDDNLGEAVLYEKDLHEDIISNNIANPENIRQGYAILNDGKLYARADWAVISVPVSEGQKITFGGFELGTNQTAYYSFFNGANPIGDSDVYGDNSLPKTITVPSGCNLLYIDIKTPQSPSGSYNNLMINYGESLLPKDEYETAVTSIKGHQLAGKGNDEQLEARVNALEDAVYDNIGTLIADLPVSDGTGIEVGYAYIDSSTGVVKIKMS